MLRFCQLFISICTLIKIILLVLQYIIAQFKYYLKGKKFKVPYNNLSLPDVVLSRWIVDVQVRDIDGTETCIDMYVYVHICTYIYITRVSLAIPLTYESAFLISLGEVFMHFSDETRTGRRIRVYWNCPLCLNFPQSRPYFSFTEKVDSRLIL